MRSRKPMTRSANAPWTSDPLSTTLSVRSSASSTVVVVAKTSSVRDKLAVVALRLPVIFAPLNCHW